MVTEFITVENIHSKETTDTIIFLMVNLFDCTLHIAHYTS